jgi:excisionase family DNA binding protein
MARTKKPQPDSTHEPGQQTAVVNGLPAEVLTLREAAAYLRLPEADVISAIHTQRLPGRLIRGEWRFLRAAIQQWLGSGSPNPETRKAALLAAAGSFKDDPDLDAIVEEAMRRRGRAATEGD